MIEINKVIEILSKHGLICAENQVCNLSSKGNGCNCGQLYKELRGE
jgi:hypothetical protein